MFYGNTPLVHVAVLFALVAGGCQHDAGKAEARIEALGGNVTRGQDALGRPHVAVSFFKDNQVGDEDLIALQELGALDRLILSGTNITDVGVAHVADLRTLTALELNDTPVTNAAINHLRGLSRLTHLNLAGTAITDEAIAQLRQMPHLRLVNLCQTGVTAEQVAWLREQLPLAGIHAGPLRVWTPSCALPMPAAQQEAAATLTAAGATVQVDANGRVRRVRVHRAPLADEDFTALAVLPNLQVLTVAATPLSDEGMKHLAGLRQLETLWLYDTLVTEAGLAQLGLCDQL